MNKRILKIIALIIVYILISIGVYLILKVCGLTSVSKIRDLVQGLGIMGYIAFFVFQIVTSTFICVIPFEDELFTLVALVLFGPIKGFFIASFNMFTTSIIQFIIGRYFCKSLIAKIIGGDGVKKYQKFLQIKGEIMLPVLYAIPLFPHDTLCILSGMSKMKFWYFVPVTLIMRSIEIACVCFFGGGFIDFSALTMIDWIMIINILIIDTYLVFKLYKFIENKINKNIQQNT